MVIYKYIGLETYDLETFCEMIPYISSKILSYEKKDDSVVINCSDEYNDEILSELKKLNDMLSSTNLGSLSESVLEDYTDNNSYVNRDIFNELLKKEFVREISNGAFCYSGLFLKIYNYFDKKIKQYAFEQFDNIREEIYPILYPVEEYIKGGYFENFPHYMMFQSKFKNNIETYERFSKLKCSCGCEDLGNYTTCPKNVLRHAACAPVYPYMENKVLKKDEGISFFVSGKCFRNEETNLSELSRVNEFLMKEYVFIGNNEFITENIEKSKELARFWIKKFKLNAKSQNANDSFFASNFKKLKYFQIIGNSKVEYKFLVPNTEKYISCCSANFHRTHFSKPYNIKNESGEYCYTACFAFGIERLTYSLLSQKGLDFEKWDEEILEEISKYERL